MARIRSTHPTQWNDDDFIECSPLARLLTIGIRNFADDCGVFEWKPGQIKRNCLPADACDVKPLLEELVRHNQVKKYTVDGRDYGVIRNFRKWQRPKKPNTIYPLPDELRKYVGLDAAGTSEPASGSGGDDTPVSAARFGTGSEKRPADVGGRREESVKPEPNGSAGSQERVQAEVSASAMLDDKTWLFREGLRWLRTKTSRSESTLRSQLGKWAKDAHDDLALLRDVLQDAIDQDVVEPLAWVTRAIPARLGSARGKFGRPTSQHLDRWRNMVDGYKRTGIWPKASGPRPDEAGCLAPFEILRRFGYEPELPHFSDAMIHSSAANTAKS
jgi:hypothetical protein